MGVGVGVGVGTGSSVGGNLMAGSAGAVGVGVTMGDATGVAVSSGTSVADGTGVDSGVGQGGLAILGPGVRDGVNAGAGAGSTTGIGVGDSSSPWRHATSANTPTKQRTATHPDMGIARSMSFGLMAVDELCRFIEVGYPLVTLAGQPSKSRLDIARYPNDLSNWLILCLLPVSAGEIFAMLGHSGTIWNPVSRTPTGSRCAFYKVSSSTSCPCDKRPYLSSQPCVRQMITPATNPPAASPTP